MITDEQKLSLLQMGINNAETYDEAHDIADFIFSNDEKQQIGFSSIGDLLSASKRTNSGTADDDTIPTLANAKVNGGPAQNGLYIVYADGAFQFYDEEMEYFNERKMQHGGVRGIGIKYYDHFFTVALKDAGCQPLFKHSRSNDDSYVVYHPTEISALADWDCLSNDSNMKLNGITFELPCRMFVPTLAQLALMSYHVECCELNDALTLVGGEPIKTVKNSESIYWSSTEFDRFNGWGIDMTIGMIHYDYNTCVDCLGIRPIYM